METIIRIIAKIILLLLLLLVIYILWLNINDKIEIKIEEMENGGIRYINNINKLVASSLSWSVKREALDAIDKIRDASSIRVLINQLYSKRNVLLYCLDYQEVYKTEAFQEEVMYVLVNYGDSVFEYLVTDLERKGFRKVSDNILFAMGLLKKEEATYKLIELKKNPNWTSRQKTIDIALRLTEQKKCDKTHQTVLLNKGKINDAIEELNLAIEEETNPLQLVHLTSLIKDLGIMKVEASRDTLKKVIQRQSEILKVSAIESLGRIGKHEDVKFLLSYLDHSDIDVRREIIIALGLIESEDAIAALEEVLKSKYEAPRNKHLAKESLKQIRERQ